MEMQPFHLASARRRRLTISASTWWRRVCARRARTSRRVCGALSTLEQTRCQLESPHLARCGEEGAGHGFEEQPSVYHSITWSARWSSDGGMVRPSALAVLGLLASSYLSGCSIGRSAGLAPLRILSI